MRQVGYAARVGKRCIQGFGGGKLKGNRSLGGSRRRSEDNITTDIQEVGWVMVWIDQAQDKDRWWDLVNVAVNFRVP
jgi:hypothetical protein